MNEFATTRLGKTFTPLFYRNVQVADALAHAHSNKLLYRDIKPSNLFKFAEAIETLSENLTMSDESDLPWDLYVISLSHASLGNLTDADHYFRLAQRWSHRKSEDGRILKENQRHELEALRAEAKAAIGALRRQNGGKELPR